jgi:peptidylprolyl isomerase
MSSFTGASVSKTSEKKTGDGETRAVSGQKIYCHYVGTLLNGQKFDSSRDKRRPFSFTVGLGQPRVNTPQAARSIT